MYTHIDGIDLHKYLWEQLDLLRAYIRGSQFVWVGAVGESQSYISGDPTLQIVAGYLVNFDKVYVYQRENIIIWCDGVGSKHDLVFLHPDQIQMHASNTTVIVSSREVLGNSIIIRLILERVVNLVQKALRVTRVI